MTALRDFTMTVRQGEFACVVGPTGCGKSTTLNLVTGLAPPSAGEVRVMGHPVSLTGQHGDLADLRKRHELGRARTARHFECGPQQIGRASCRDRVCTDVYLSVVARSFKQQQEQSPVTNKHTT